MLLLSMLLLMKLQVLVKSYRNIWTRSKLAFRSRPSNVQKLCEILGEQLWYFQSREMAA
jgi:hypothetical protein